MAKPYELAMEALASLPAADQDRLARQLLTYVERLLTLRIEITKGIRAFDAGEGGPLDVEAIVRRQNERHGRT